MKMGHGGVAFAAVIELHPASGKAQSTANTD